MVSRLQKTLLVVVFCALVAINNASWGSGKNARLLQWISPIGNVQSSVGFAAFGLMFGSAVLLTMSLLGWISPKIVISHDADADYTSEICNKFIIACIVQCIYEWCRVSGYLYLNTLVSVIFVYVLADWYAYAHQKKLEIWMQILLGGLLAQFVYGSINLFVIVGQLSEATSFGLLFLGAFFMYAVAYEYEDWVLAAEMSLLLFSIFE